MQFTILPINFLSNNVDITKELFFYLSQMHTLGAVGSRHCGAQGAVGGSVPCSRVSPQSWTIPAGAEI